MTAPKLTPPPPSGNGLLDRWLNLLWRKLTAAGEILWGQIDTTGTCDFDGNVTVAGNTTLGDAAATDTHTINGATVINVNSASDALRITQTGSGNAILVEDSTNPDSSPFAVSADGKVSIGQTSIPASSDALVELYNPTSAIDAVSGDAVVQRRLRRASGDTTAGGLYYDKARGTIASPAAVVSGDFLGDHVYRGWDGDSFVNGGLLRCLTDGTPDNNAIPAQYVIQTSDGGRFSITAIARSGNVVTATTSVSVAHRGTVGAAITVSGVSLGGGGTDFNGSFTIASFPATNQITWAQTAADDSSTTGTAIITGTIATALRVHSSKHVVIGPTGVGGGATFTVNRAATGATTAYSAGVTAVANRDVTTAYNVFSSSAGTEAATFSLSGLRHYFASQGTFGSGSTVTSQFGFYASSNLTGATNNYGFYSDIASSANRWNFFANGTANNAFAGNVRIGSTTAPTAALDITGSIIVSDSVCFGFVTTATNLTLSTAHRTVKVTATCTITLPTAVACDGREYVIKNASSTAVVTVATTSSQTIDGLTTQTIYGLSSMTVVSDGANWMIV